MNSKLKPATAAFFTGRSTVEIAQDLLGKELLYHSPSGLVGGWIVETEAYLGQNDSAAHAYQGRRTAFSEPLYLAPGTLYIYRLRAYLLVDIVTQAIGDPQGVLIRAIQPSVGLAIMQNNRPVAAPQVTNGPGKLMQALGITDQTMNRQNLETADLQVNLANARRPQTINTSQRIGVSQNGSGAQAPLRFTVAHNPYLSRATKKSTDWQTAGWQTAQTRL